MNTRGLYDMTDTTQPQDEALARILDALDEQMVEVKLFQAKLAELAREVEVLTTALDGFDQDVEGISQNVGVLRQQSDETARVLGRF